METVSAISWSQANCYADCPRKWAYRYLDRAVEAPSVALAQGKAVHEQIERYLLHHHPADANPLTRFADDTLRQQVDAVFEVEVEVGKEIDGLYVRGFVDVLVTFDNGRKVIIDWKTSGRKPQGMKPAYRNQLSLYAYLEECGSHDAIMIAYPQYGDMFTEYYDPALGEQTFDWIVRTADKISYMKENVSSAAETQGTPGWFECRYCPYVADCPDSYERQKKKLRKK